MLFFFLFEIFNNSYNLSIQNHKILFFALKSLFDLTVQLYTHVGSQDPYKSLGSKITYLILYIFGITGISKIY